MKTIFDIRFWTFGGWFTWVAVAIGGSALLGAGVSIYEGNQTRNAIGQEQSLLNNLTYQPIDIPKLQAAATAASIQDATNSLKLQTQLQPDVVRSNQLLQKSVADQLAQGGNLPPDVANQVAQAARTSTGVSGAIGNAAPLTSALIGQNALALLQQRQQAATSLSAANPAPSVGLSAQDIASATEANSNAVNNFALAKAGGQTSLINSAAQNSAGTAAGVGGAVQQALGLLALTRGSGTGTTTLQPAAGSFSTPGTGYGIPTGANLTANASNIGGLG